LFHSYGVPGIGGSIAGGKASPSGGERGETMISWRKDFGPALQEAKRESKIVFFDIFNPG
jgi:hypothetical protein